MGLTRRAWLSMAMAAALPIPVDARAGRHAERIVALDWGLAETLLALDMIPTGVAEAPGYRHRVIEPALPADVVDVGLRVAPNLELLQQLAPDLLLVPPWFGANRPLLDRIGATDVLEIHGGAARPYAAASSVTIAIGRRLGREALAINLLAAAADQLSEVRARLAALDRPLHVVSFLDRSHVAVYGADSMFGDVVALLGLRNAWQHATGQLGIAVASIEQLAHTPDAILVYVEPLPPGVPVSVFTEPLWRTLPSVAARRVIAIPPVWLFGAVPSALRFARLLAAHLGEHGGHE